MPDFYPSEKGVIRRDRTGEARDVMARELMMESLGMIPIGGMAAKMSSPAVDVLSRWIRRYRKDKAPTVPEKHIEKALKNEDMRRGLGNYYGHMDDSMERLYRNPTIRTRRESYTDRPEIDNRYLGFQEKPEFDRLHEFIEMLRRMPDKIEKLGGR